MDVALFLKIKTTLINVFVRLNCHMMKQEGLTNHTATPTIKHTFYSYFEVNENHQTRTNF